MTKNEADRKKNKKKDFDVLKWKRRIQAEIYKEIKDLTPEQELEYWRKAAERGPRGERWRAIHERSHLLREGSRRS